MEIKRTYIFRNSFTIAYLIFMSGTILLLISADHYIEVIHSECHERTATNKLLTN